MIKEMADSLNKRLLSNNGLAIGLLALVLCANSGVLSANELAKIRLNGFFTASAAISDEDEMFYYGITDEVRFDSDSIVGVQVEADLNEKFSSTVQIIARGDRQYNAEVEWAFIQYRAIPNLRIRAGRMRNPIYFISDHVEVGYAYPWVRPPHEVYGLIPIYTLNGFDLYYKKSYSDWNFSFQPFIGSSRRDATLRGSPVDITVDRAFGFGMKLKNNMVEFHLGHGVYDYSLNLTELGIEELDNTAYLSSFGVRINYGAYYLSSELALRDTDSQLVSDIKAWSITNAYRFGSYQPFFTVGGGRQMSNKIPAEQDSYTLGLRWDVMDNVAIKIQGEHISPTSGLGGISFENTVTVWTFAIDGIF